MESSRLGRRRGTGIIAAVNKSGRRITEGL